MPEISVILLLPFTFTHILYSKNKSTLSARVLISREKKRYYQLQAN
ncbi:hypothetical protein FDUTEX481_01273 [Tolypothrix sp. PCC 7601]|nr:hypothetical protein FDUTEX481_01273 [Tolypothrix sp. PCC 7601]